MAWVRRSVIVLVCLVVALIALAWWAEFYTDWLWFRHDAYPVVFTRRLVAKLAVFGLAAAVALVVCGGNLLLLRRRVGGRPAFAGLDVEPELHGWLQRWAGRLAAWLPVAVALLSGLGAAAAWMMWLQAVAAVPFGVSDPQFGRDVSFYVFRLAAWRQALGSLSSLILVSLAAVCALGYAYGEITVVANEIRFARAMRAQIVGLCAAALVVRAGLLWLRRYDALLVQRRLFAGAGWSDVHVALPALLLSAATALLAAAACLWILRRGVSAKAGYYALGAHVVVHICGVGLLPAIVQRVRVAPNELDLERPYIERAITATRRAFGLERVAERSFPVVSDLTAARLDANRGTIDNLRVWDHRPLLRTYAKLQEIRPYYDIIDVDSDRYELAGRQQQVLVAARELNHAKLETRAQSWVNLHVEYTHGIGLVISPANQVNDKGQPAFLASDIPPRVVPGLELREPRIYFGEVIRLPAEVVRGPGSLLPQQQAAQQQARPDEEALRLRRRLNSVAEPDDLDYLLVGTRRDELDFVAAAGSGQEKRTTRYRGRSGVPLGGFWRRLLFGLRFRSIELVVTGLRTPESRLLYCRQVTRRCQRAAPFLRWDDNPYAVIADGRLAWICEGYTFSASYPYSEIHLETVSTARGPRRVPTWSYLRNPVKAVVDAYDGTVTLYRTDPDDPIAATLDRLFPGLMRPLDEASESLRRHFRYPQLLFRTQAAMYREYHMTDPTVFYTQEDRWSPAQEIDRELERQLQQSGRPVKGAALYRDMTPFYQTMCLPGERNPEFILLLPFTPYSAQASGQREGERDNLIAWMAARCDPERYGELVVFTFPKDTNIYGPRQIESRIDQDDAISQQITLWDKGGSQVVRGNLVVVPIDSALLYIQPLYLESEKQGFPELKRVVVAYHDQIAMEPTLTAALRRLFGLRAVPTPVRPVAPRPGPRPAPGGGRAGDPSLLAAAERAFEASEEALREGDFASYERERERLAGALEALRGPRR